MEKTLIFDDSLADAIITGRKLQTRRKQAPIIKIGLEKNDIFNIVLANGKNIGKAKVTHRTISRVADLCHADYLSQGCESFLDFVNNFIKHNGPIDIYNEYISVISFEMVENSSGEKLKLIRDKYGNRYYEIQIDKRQ